MRYLVLAAFFSLSGLPSLASTPYSPEFMCYEMVEREQWEPPTRNRPGFWRSWTESMEVSCDHTTRRGHVPHAEVQDRECSPTRGILGGIFGGAAGAALSQGPGQTWAIPLGVGVGAVIGCQID